MSPPPYYGPILFEDHWLRCADPAVMEEFLGERGSPRRWQLFACLCCWRVLPLLDDRSRHAVSVAERQAEGVATRDEVQEALSEANAAVHAAWQPNVDRARGHAAFAALSTLQSPRRAYVHVGNAVGEHKSGERAAQCRLLRELFGNPFRPFVVDPPWRSPLRSSVVVDSTCRTPTVQAIAAQIYDREQFEELPVLGDALEDAGCDDPHLLAHLREQTTHHRGCWALDAVLNKR